MRNFNINKFLDKYNKLVEEVKQRQEGLDKLGSLEALRDVGLIVKDLINMRIDITMKIEDNEVTRNYSLLSFEDKDWNDEMGDIYSTLTTDVEPMMEDRTDEDGIASYE